MLEKKKRTIDEKEAELSQRKRYPTAIGLVCMTKKEHEMYLEALAERQGL